MQQSGFVMRIAAAWMDAAEYADRYTILVGDDHDAARFWEREADRCEALGRLVFTMTQTGGGTAAV
jgi:hypothetical protein